MDVIKSFKSRDAEPLFNDEEVKQWRNLQNAARRKLNMLHAATKLSDLKIPPGDRLEKLAGDRRGRYSIRINDQYRACFEWREGDAYEVEITDYH
jgi:proteic killer suppression protein